MNGFKCICIALSLLLGFVSCGPKKVANPYEGFVYDPNEDESVVVKIPYKDYGADLISLPVTINDGLGLNMIYDTGASVVNISLLEALQLVKNGTLTEEDVTGAVQQMVADGTLKDGVMINLRELSIGGKVTLKNVQAVISESAKAPLILGRNVFKMFREVSVDESEKVVKFYKY